MTTRNLARVLSSKITQDQDTVPHSTKRAEEGDSSSATLNISLPTKTSEDDGCRRSVTDMDIEATTAEPAQPPSPHPFAGLRWYLLLIGLYLSGFLYGLDNTIVANIQGSVISDFGHVEQLSWMGSGFPLGSIATILPIGKSFGIFDNKYLYIWSILVFSVGSAVCGAAPDMNALIVGRVIAGIGGAGMYLGVLNLLSRFTTIHERSTYIGILGFVWGAGSILGPVIGGAFADSTATWRWAFYINLVLIAITSPIYFLFIPSTDPQPTISFWKKFLTLDWIGATLTAGIYVSWVIALQFGGIIWHWDDGRTISTFVVLGVTILAFCIQQKFSIGTRPERRIFPVMFLTRRTPLLMFLATASVTALVFVPVFYIPVYFQFVNGDSGVQSAVRLLPLVLFLVFINLVTGYLLPVIGWYMPFFLIAGIIATVGSALMFVVSPTTSSSQIYGASALIGIAAGMGTSKGYSLLPALLMSPSTHHTAAKRKPEPQYIPASISFLNVAQIGSIVHCLAISGSIFQNLAYRNLLSVFNKVGLEFAEADVRAAVAGTKSKVFEGLQANVRTEAVAAIVNSISTVYALCLAASALLVVISLALRWERLFQKPRSELPGEDTRAKTAEQRSEDDAEAHRQVWEDTGDAEHDANRIQKDASDSVVQN